MDIIPVCPLPQLRLSKPGLFVTATDTGVGKTVVTCAIAHALRQHGLGVGVCKPFASGCDKDRHGLVSQDARALAYFAQCGHRLDVINPIRYAAPLAPAVAAQQLDVGPDYQALERSLKTIDATRDVLLVEGIGGLLVPLDPHHTVRDLAVQLGYPVVVVTQAGLGTLNHTAMTVSLLRQAGCEIAGLVVNGYEADSIRGQDPSVTSNPKWLEHMNQTRILATVPACPSDSVRSDKGRIPTSILEAIGAVHWPGVLATPRVPDTGR